MKAQNCISIRGYTCHLAKLLVTDIEILILTKLNSLSFHLE